MTQLRLVRQYRHVENCSHHGDEFEVHYQVDDAGVAHVTTPICAQTGVQPLLVREFHEVIR